MTPSVDHALLVVDMQNDFILPTSPVCVAEGLAATPTVIEAVEVARASGIAVIWVVRDHHPHGLDVEYSRRHHFKDGGGVCVRDTEGAALVSGLRVAPGDVVIRKRRFSGFFATELDLVLRGMGVDRLTICGVQTPNCIRATAFDAVSLGYDPVIVLSDATASANPSVQSANLYDLAQIGIATPTMEDWASSLVAERAAKEAI